jgi:hypothetical protein
MRELALPETLYLCAGLLLCLALPIMMGVCAPQDVATRAPRMKIVWPRQVLLAIAGLVAVFSAAAAPYAAVFGLVSYLVCAFVLRQRLRAPRAG